MEFGSLTIENGLADFVAEELLPGSGVRVQDFWAGLESICRDLGPTHQAMLDRRDELQALIDDWHRERAGATHDSDTYADFLRDIGYLSYYTGEVAISTSNVDEEITSIAGPQLVVPLDNSRYALNAANARWGSLYDALYGTDAIAEAEGCANTKRYNPIRGVKVVAYGRDFLDRHFSLDQASHAWSVRYFVRDGDLHVESGDGTVSTLLRPERFVGYTGEENSPDSIMLRKNGLRCEIRIGAGHFIGRGDHASIYDIQIESAVTAIMDCEDSVAAVDVDDKLTVYRNWLGLMQGTLKRSFVKDGETIDRLLEGDRVYLDPLASPATAPGRALMLVRNVGPHLRTEMVTIDGEPVFETIIDAMVTSLAAKHDLLGCGAHRNSRTGSIYIVKPKMHGAEEVALAVDLFGRVEDVLGLERNTLKMGIMDEERRTSLSLKACIAAASERVVFINTGFLDRTGDEIHTSMEAGPVLPKAEMKSATWLKSYENSNVDTGLDCGLQGKAQIGKGMWAMPSEMDAMLKTKIAHPLAGANCAWVPSPTAATLHATHYFLLDVRERQLDLATRKGVRVHDLLAIPTLDPERTLTPGEVQRELENNVQGILGYVARWVGQGVGCSTVKDIDDVGLMEDCATLRISSQHVANWLHHGLLTTDQIEATLLRMAALVDQQNAGDSEYLSLATNPSKSIPFQAARDLILLGRHEPNGYTERILQARRRELKATVR